MLVSVLCSTGYVAVEWDGEYVGRQDAVWVNDDEFICCCPYAADVHDTLVLKAFSESSYSEACMDI